MANDKEIKIHYANNNLPKCKVNALYPLTTIDKSKVTCTNCLSIVTDFRKHRDFHKTTLARLKWDLKILFDRMDNDLDFSEIKEKIKNEYKI